MLILDHFFSQVQLFFSGQVRVHVHFLGLVAPHPLFQPHTHLVLLDTLRLADLFQLLFVLFCDVGPGNDLGLLFDEVGDKGGVFLEEGFF